MPLSRKDKLSCRAWFASPIPPCPLIHASPDSCYTEFIIFRSCLELLLALCLVGCVPYPSPFPSSLCLSSRTLVSDYKSWPLSSLCICDSPVALSKSSCNDLLTYLFSYGLGPPWTQELDFDSSKSPTLIKVKVESHPWDERILTGINWYANEEMNEWFRLVSLGQKGTENCVKAFGSPVPLCSPFCKILGDSSVSIAKSLWM